MQDRIYYCENENNECSKKDTCARYLKATEFPCKTTLFKNSCTENNQYILHIESESVNNDAENTGEN